MGRDIVSSSRNNISELKLYILQENETRLNIRTFLMDMQSDHI